MVFDLFDPLFPDDISSRAKEAIIRGTIEVALTEGYTRNYTMELLRDKNLHFDDKVFRAHWNELADYRSRFESPTYLDWDVKPRDALLPEGKYPITGDYGYVGRVSYLDPETEEEKYHTFRMDSDTLLSKAEVYEELNLFAQFGSAPPGDIISDVIYLGVFKNPS